MFIWAILFLLLLAGAAIASFIVGDREQKLAIAIIVIGSLATLAVFVSEADAWRDSNLRVFAIDSLAFIIFVWIALRSRGFWPMWVAAFQLVNVMTHIARLASAGILPEGYGAGQSLWGYLQVGIIFCAALRFRQRKKLNGQV